MSLPTLSYSDFVDVLCSQCPFISRNSKQLTGYYSQYKEQKSKGKWNKTLVVINGVIYYQDSATPKLVNDHTTEDHYPEEDQMNLKDIFEEGKDYSFDEYVARKFVLLKKGADQRGKEFNLSLTSVRNLLKANKCFYTGITLTGPVYVGNVPFNLRTIDRVDPEKGYVKGNVVCCAHVVNQLKSSLEKDGNGLTVKDKVKMMRKLIKLVG